MIGYLAQDVAWLLVLGAVQSLHARLWLNQPRTGQVVTGLLFGLVCVLGLSDPYIPLSDITLDGSSVMMGILGLFGGALPAAVALVIVGGFRFVEGAPHTLVVLIVLLGSAVLGLLFRYAIERGRAKSNVQSLLLFGLVLQLFRMAFFALSPIEIPNFFLVATTLILVFTPATLLLALLLKEGQRRDALDVALRESEARFRMLVKDIPGVSVQAYGRDGTTLYWNKASESLYGFTAEEAIGRNLRDLIIPPPMREGVREAMEAMFSTHDAIPSGELVLQHKDGSPVPVFSSHAFLQTPGRPAELFCVDIDLSARYRAEAELSIAATAFEAQEGVVVTDPEQRILRVNKAFAESLGYTAADVRGRPLSILIVEPDTKVPFSDIQQALKDSGKWVGEIWSQRKNGTQFPQWININAVHDAAGGIIYFVVTLSDITQRKADEEQIRQLAFFDPLTDLPNRRLLMDRLQHALNTSERTGRTGALLFIDLDNFKALNDTRGHDQGDQLLRQSGKRLSGCVRDCDTVARLGGDEFLVMLENLDESLESAAANARAVGEKIVAALNQTYQLGDFDFHSTASVGVAMYSGMSLSIDELLKQADLAMYQAKTAGRNRLRFFDPSMQAVVNARASLERDMSLAIAQQQFELYYQPQVDQRGRVIGAEALLRWPHPQRGMVSPASFIPLAEETGHILPLGQWVLETACRQLVAWSQHPLLEQIVVAVNVSARQFREATFVDSLLAVVVATGVNPQRLKLELTESMLIESLDELVCKMTALREQGIGLSLDDFGTGYSSLSYLRRLPLDQLKIDQSFVRDVLTDTSDAAIARTVVALAQNLDLVVIAEGVETLEQKEFLAQCGCYVYQGFLFSRAVPAPQFAEFVAQSRVL